MGTQRQEVAVLADIIKVGEMRWIGVCHTTVGAAAVPLVLSPNRRCSP
jgi:hypothetical protein